MVPQHNKRNGNIYNTCQALRAFKNFLLHMKQSYGYCEVMEPDLSFLEMFFKGLAYWEDLECDWHLHFSINTMMTKFIRFAQEFEADCNRVSTQKQWINWDVVMYDFKKTFQQFEAQARDICVLLLGGAYKCASCPSNQKRFLEYVRDTENFTDFILQSLRLLQSSRLMAPALKQKIHLIQRGLEEFRMFVDPPKILFDLISRNRAWINRISCLTYLFWIDGNDENLASAMETMLSDLLHEIMPCRSLGVVSSFLQYEKNLQPLVGYLDLLLQDLVIPMKDDVYEGVIFLLAFVMDTDVDVDLEDSKMIWAQSFAAIKKLTSLIYSHGYGEREGGVCAVELSDFLVTVDTVKVRLRILHVVAPYSSKFPSPSTNVIGFLNSMTENLNEMLEEEVNCIPSLRHQGELLQNELMPLLKNATELLIDEDEEMRDLWTDISCTVYNADYFIRLSHSKSCFVWYGIAGLPTLVQDIDESVKRKIDRLVGVDKKSSGHRDPVKGADVLQPRGTTSENEEVYMGFIEDKRVIIDHLTRGSNSLTIISISGSGGQGKTTLAKQIYNDRKVQYHFSKSCWCYISKDRPIKEILVQIIGDVIKGDDREIGVQNMGVQELADLLRKSLKGRRFFIVMDDIWDVEVWSELELSFPDDKKGSRILFTSRNHDLASQAKSNSISRALPLFTDEESWELMKKRVFGSDLCDEEFVGIGKQIASYCKGLPLAISLTAAVLGRSTQQNLNSWNKVAGNLNRHLAEEGCENVLKLSYTHLPKYLKSCFLYFRTFGRGEEVRAKELKMLWVGEGFVIPNGEAKITETDLAAKYLNDLVSQGLVGVTKWSTMGEIKRCSVHDLLYDMCLEICKEDNYLTWVANNNALDLKSVNGHRVQIGLTIPFISSNPSTKRALPVSPLYSLTYEGEFFLSIQHFGSCKLLTVLNLKKIRLKQDIFLEVTSLIHLRYLAIHFWNSNTAIPLEIANLWKLGALILKGAPGVTTLLPLSMWNRKSLRHVDIQRARLNLDEFDLGEPDKVFGGALYLEALGSLFLDVDDSRTTEFLRNFPNLRKLRCELNKGTEPIMKLLLMVVSLLSHLESLRVDVLYSKMGNLNRNPVLWSLPKNENLIKLRLDGIPWSVVSEIGKRLPNLRVLKLRHLSRVEKRWKLEDGDFPKLIYLRLSSLWFLEEIDVSICDDLPFPCLEHLVLVYCPRLKEIPSIFGEHSCLERIEVDHCKQRVRNSAISILEQQRDFGNGNFQVMVDYSESEESEDEYSNSEEDEDDEDDEYVG